MKTKYKNHTIALSMLFLGLFGLVSCMDSKSESSAKGDTRDEGENNPSEEMTDGVLLTAKQFEALQMEVGPLQTRKMGGYVEANGQLEVPPQNEATITSVVGANIVAIEVIEGDKVDKGQTVAYLSHPNIIQKQTDYLDAYSNSRFLEKEFDRQKRLYEAGVGSGANFQKAEAEYEASRSRAQGLAAQLQQLSISPTGVRNGTIYQRIALRSPIAGHVQKVNIKTGQYVEPQTNLIRVVDTHHVHADLMVFEKDVYKIEEGQKVTFNVQSVPGKELTAEIYSVGKTFEQDAKALHVHAEIENKQGNLIPGMYIQGRIQTNEAMTDAIPEGAIAADGERRFIFKAVEEGDAWSFVPTEVVLGVQDGDWTEVTFLESLASDARYAQNNAYYLMAEMKKGEAEHPH